MKVLHFVQDDEVQVWLAAGKAFDAMRLHFTEKAARAEIDRHAKATGNSHSKLVKSLGGHAHRQHLGHVVGQRAVEAQVGCPLADSIRLAQHAQRELRLARARSTHHADDAGRHLDARHPGGQAGRQAGDRLLQSPGQRRDVRHHTEAVFEKRQHLGLDVVRTATPQRPGNP